MATNPPNNTIYVRNLEERIKLPELTSTLHELFSGYGTIVEIVAKKNVRAKGQAFVVFGDVESATNALEEIQGFELFDKPIALDFAKTQSDAIVKANGTAEDFEVHKRKRLAEKERKQAIEKAEQVQKEKLKRPAPQDDEQKPGAKQQKTGAGSKGTTRSAVVPDEYLPPNKILFVQNAPEDYDIEALSGLFGRFEGFKEVRLVPGRKGLAFVEYDGEAGAISAKESTAGMALGADGQAIKVTYQRQ